MPRPVVIDEWVVTLRVAADLPDARAQTVRRARDARMFRARLRRAVRAAVRADPALAGVRVRVSR